MVPKACGESRGGLIWPATGVQNSSHLGATVTFTTPFTFSFEEYADMIYVYGFCDGCVWFHFICHMAQILSRQVLNGRHCIVTYCASFGNRDLAVCSNI